jgi:4-oxalocrotonate tautomerase
MPLIDVRLYDHRVTEESVPKIIEKLTDALHEASGASKEAIHVIVTGVSPTHWGQAGKPGTPPPSA